MQRRSDGGTPTIRDWSATVPRTVEITAAERIRSSHDQNRVLAALVKAERR